MKNIYQPIVAIPLLNPLSLSFILPENIHKINTITEKITELEEITLQKEQLRYSITTEEKGILKRMHKIYSSRI